MNFLIINFLEFFSNYPILLQKSLDLLLEIRNVSESDSEVSFFARFNDKGLVWEIWDCIF